MPNSNLPLPNRCWKCDNCKTVRAVRDTCYRALAHADIRRYQGDRTYSVGEDVRLIWNKTLTDFPCEETHV